jgi:hypothetical protein
MQELRALRAELQAAQTAVANASTAELSLVEQKLQFAQERLDMTQSHAKSQIEAAEGRAQLAQNELLRLQVPHAWQLFPVFVVEFDANLQAELLSASHTLASTQLQHQSLQQQVLLLKDDAKASAAAAEAAAAALSTSQGRIEKLEIALEEQKAEHLKELRKSRDEQYVSRLLVAVFDILTAFAAGLLCASQRVNWRSSIEACNPDVQPKRLQPVLRELCTRKRFKKLSI